ncbi:MAG: hypothetical protein ACFE8M_02365 [Candidatus Hermodarchaeota archaeon]
MSDQIKLLLYIKNMLSDLIYLNCVIATELIKVTENTAAQRHGEDFLKQTNCISEHTAINENILNVLNKYYKTSEDSEKMERLKSHVLNHPKKKQ